MSGEKIRSQQFLVLWDFPERPKSTFYDVLDAEFRDGGLRFVQQSVYWVRDEETARVLRALARWYGASRVEAFCVTGALADNAAADRDAENKIADVHAARLKRRGRKPTLKRRR